MERRKDCKKFTEWHLETKEKVTVYYNAVRKEFEAGYHEKTCYNSNIQHLENEIRALADTRKQLKWTLVILIRSHWTEDFVVFDHELRYKSTDTEGVEVYRDASFRGWDEKDIKNREMPELGPSVGPPHRDVEISFTWEYLDAIINIETMMTTLKNNMTIFSCSSKIQDFLNAFLKDEISFNLVPFKTTEEATEEVATAVEELFKGEE